MKVTYEHKEIVLASLINDYDRQDTRATRGALWPCRTATIAAEQVRPNKCGMSSAHANRSDEVLLAREWDCLLQKKSRGACL